MELLNSPSSDTISEVLRAVNVHSAIYCISELRSPWGFRVMGAQVAKFHLVIEGSGWLELDDREPVHLDTRELVLLPRGDEHIMRDGPGSPVRQLDHILEEHPPDAEARMAYGGGGAVTRLLCGGFAMSEPIPPSVEALLPDILHLDATSAGLAAWLDPVFSLLQGEADTSQPGAAVVLAKIADVFLTQALRSYLLGSARAGLLDIEPLREPAIARAVDMMRRQPTHPWTLTELAKEADMSRTAFTSLFRRTVGDTPMHYLAQVRLGVAAGLLATTDASIFHVAQQSGYDNDASLSRAFKRHFAVPPGEYRRRSVNTPLVEGV